jgi:hypothetical protein
MREPLEFVPCPECGLPAEVADEFTLRSTDGPVVHVVTHCVGGHWLTPPMERVAGLAGVHQGTAITD